MIPLPGSREVPFITSKAIFDMLRHGHIQESISYLCQPPKGESYPFDAAGEAMNHCKDDPTAREGIMRAAVAAMLQSQQDNPFAETSFVRLLNRHWDALPESKARGAVRKFVERILAKPDLDAHRDFRLGGQRRSLLVIKTM
jgi:hypothetical protein